ncbi:MAG: branched-chain amino acid ABC transporter permease [Chloroflexi bacterium]|nr:branched-chain amino acid ABC transporter permease [Chloroflexota bacterium]
METTISKTTAERPTLAWLRQNRGTLAVLVVLLLLPFIIAIIDGQSISSVLANESGNSKFFQGLLIEIFILGLFALSYDLLLGITGLLSLGHAMFFAVGGYLTGILIKSFGWGLVPTIAAVTVAAIVQALLFAVVLPRVKGLTFALVTLGFASVFHIVVQSREAAPFTGADVGLQGVVIPAFLDPVDQRLRVYFIALLITMVVYFLYQRFVDSPTGRVCIAIRENEDRALMLGYNTFQYKVIVLLISSLTAAFAGMLHTIHQPIVSPNIAGLGYMVIALLIILIGGVGTLSGALIGAAVFRLLDFFIDRWFGEAATFLLGVIYVLLVLFVPFGIVGTWRQHSSQFTHQIEAIIERLRPKKENPE